MALAFLRFAALVLALVLALAGCASQPVTKEKLVSDWPEYRAAIGELADWALDGRIGLKTADDGWNGTLSWRQNADNVDFRFRGPLGLGGFRIHGDRERLRVRTSDGGEFWLTDPAAELQAEFGWSVPVHSMRFWMLGIPDPDEEAEEILGPDGLLEGFEQLGWIVEYESFRSVGGLLLPRKIVMVGGDIRIRVAVDRWTLD